MEKTAVCSICGQEFTVEFPEYVSEDEDPSFVQGISLRLNLGAGKFLVTVPACNECVGKTIIRFSDEELGMKEFVTFLGKVEEETSEETEDVPSDDPEDEAEIMDEKKLEETAGNPWQEGNILTDEMIEDLEDPAEGFLGEEKIEDLQEGDIFTEEMLYKMEAEDA